MAFGLARSTSSVTGTMPMNKAIAIHGAAAARP